jgi:hypothetical protein
MSQNADTRAANTRAANTKTRSREIRWLSVGGCLSVAALLCAVPQIAQANKKPLALPPAVLAAKTIYIDNQTNDAGLQNNAYMGLARWGHFQVVEDAQKADVVLRMTGRAFVQTVPSDTPPDMSMKPGNTRAGGEGLLPSGDAAAPEGFTRLTLVDPKSGAAWWSDLSKTNRPEAATHMLDGLREAFEQGLKARGK